MESQSTSNKQRRKNIFVAMLTVVAVVSAIVIVVVALSSGASNAPTTDVQQPVLTLVANDVTITYGQPLPELTFDCQGLQGQDTPESIGLNVQCVVEDDCQCVGVKEITFAGEVPDGYDVQYQIGHLTVLPKEIAITRPFVKTYDGTNYIDKPTVIWLDGVETGDEVVAKADKIYFENKNAGEQQVVTANICLTGKDADNYVLCSEAHGRILPRNVKVAGLKIDDKFYDGTTKAKISVMGKLEGVLAGDSVAIGNLEVNFDSAEIGTHEIVVENVVLVGVDKDNYRIGSVDVDEASILNAE